MVNFILKKKKVNLINLILCFTQYSSLLLCLFFDYPQTRKKKIYTVLEFTFMFIFLLSPNKKKKKKLHQKIYTVLEFTKLEYCVNFFFFFKKKVLEPGRLEYCVNGTRVYQARVPQKNF